MNVHHHAIWPPPGACKLNHPAPAARHGELPQLLQQFFCAGLIYRVVHSPDDAASLVINRSDKE